MIDTDNPIGDHSSPNIAVDQKWYMENHRPDRHREPMPLRRQLRRKSLARTPIHHRAHRTPHVRNLPPRLRPAPGQLRPRADFTHGCAQIPRRAGYGLGNLPGKKNQCHPNERQSGESLFASIFASLIVLPVVPFVYSFYSITYRLYTLTQYRRQVRGDVMEKRSLGKSMMNHLFPKLFDINCEGKASGVTDGYLPLTQLRSKI